MLKQFGVIGLASIVISLTASTSFGQEITRIRTEDKCEAVAKIIDGDSRHKPMSRLCQEDKISADNGGTVRIFCFPLGKILSISRGGVISNHCSLQGQRVRGCSLLNRERCVVVKGPSEDQLKRITPYGIMNINSRPALSWTPISSVTKYSVGIKGVGTNWKVEVEGNSLIYPKDKPALELGNVYVVTIIALKKEEVLDSSSFALLVLSEEQVQEIAETIDTLKSLGQPEDELAIDLDTVYSAHNLVDESIKVLNFRVKAGSNNATIYRLLGDRYLMANLPQEANKVYLRAKELAQKEGDSLELEKIQVRIRITTEYISSQLK
ncbi:MAG: tetratricopeptide repeat protein [Gloeotrichia echinulata HAB0833]